MSGSPGVAFGSGIGGTELYVGGALCWRCECCGCVRAGQWHVEERYSAEEQSILAVWGVREGGKGAGRGRWGGVALRCYPFRRVRAMLACLSLQVAWLHGAKMTSVTVAYQSVLFVTQLHHPQVAATRTHPSFVQKTGSHSQRLHRPPCTNHRVF
jgi:hypothetical protein